MEITTYSGGVSSGKSYKLAVLANYEIQASGYFKVYGDEKHTKKLCDLILKCFELKCSFIEDKEVKGLFIITPIKV